MERILSPPFQRLELVYSLFQDHRIVRNSLEPQCCRTSDYDFRINVRKFTKIDLNRTEVQSSSWGTAANRSLRISTVIIRTAVRLRMLKRKIKIGEEKKSVRKISFTITIDLYGSVFVEQRRDERGKLCLPLSPWFFRARQ